MVPSCGIQPSYHIAIPSSSITSPKFMADISVKGGTMYVAPGTEDMSVKGGTMYVTPGTEDISVKGGTMYVPHGSEMAFESEAAVIAFVCKGPLWGSVKDTATPSEWVQHGRTLVAKLSAGTASLSKVDEPLATRVYHLYLPVYFFCRARVRSTRGGVAAPVIGLSAPQGCGKTTLVESLTDCFAADGMVCAAVSFDDFYLRGEEQDAVAAAHQDNDLLQARAGVARAAAAAAVAGSDGGDRPHLRPPSPNHLNPAVCFHLLPIACLYALAGTWQRRHARPTARHQDAARAHR